MGEVIRGSLYTRDFLDEGIRDTSAWNNLGERELANFRAAVRSIYDAFPIATHPNEATTEQDLIFPVLRALGWENFLPQQSASRRREDVPDALLFADAEAKVAANREKDSLSRYRHGIAIVENKAWDLPLDRGPPDSLNQNAPSTQMLRYLSRVEIQSERLIRWGILTNGRLWRLYYQGARSRAEEFLELDLPVLAGVPAVQPDLFSPPSEECAHFLKVFLLLFRRSAFVPSTDDARSYHDQALALTREWETRVSQKLSEAVFDQVFPNLVNALAASDPQAPNPLIGPYLEEVRQAALTLLYRLLFVLYAEDRNLLPSHDKGYGDYSLRALRHELREGIDRAERYGARADRFYKRLQGVFHLIDVGDNALGLPPYNGGLFDDSRQSLLVRVALPDNALAPILDDLSRRKEGEARKWINYRDLSVQHLGAIYERLFEFILVPRDGHIAIELTPFARKGSGSYYTHEDLVHLILDRAIGPLVDERLAEFGNRAASLGEDRRPKAKRLDDLYPLDPATRMLDIKVCDPAMGSGHFLVSLVDYLADEVLEAMAAATEGVTWTEKEQPYVSPLAKRIVDIRERILAGATAEGWHIERTQLDDRHIVRRMILKRVVYGVDKNMMAVELAKVALWLHTFTVGAPLSFLDHHLRCGDSLFGEQVGHAMTARRGALLINRYVQQAKRATVAMMQVEAATDADIAEVRASGQAFAGISNDTRNLVAYLDFIHALRWLDLSEGDENLVQRLLDGQFGDPVMLISGEVVPIVDDDAAAQTQLFANRPDSPDMPAAPTMAAATWEPLKKVLGAARALAQQQRFLHWEVAFPGVWSDWESLSPAGGFDAVIGNPPWDRMKLQEVEWFATRRPEIAQSVRAADRNRAASVVVHADNLNRPAQPELPTAEQKARSAWLPSSLYWMKTEEIEWPREANGKPSLEWAIGFKDVTAPTNARTMIAAAVPFAAFGNTLPLLLPRLPEPPREGASQRALAAWRQDRGDALDAYRAGAPLLLANLNSLAFDFVARQKIQGQHLNWYIVEQLPVVPSERFEEKIGRMRLTDFIRQDVLHLTYTAIDMESYARDMGYGGAAFPWDEEDRRHRRARLDALFFHLYGIGAGDAAYILDTFPIVREQDEAAFGRYRTKEMVLAYLRAIEANDLTSRVSA